MTIPYITIGCPTTGGGQVIDGDSSFLIEGVPIACLGHKATCPLHKRVSKIIGGCDDHMIIMGKPAALANALLDCGCRCLPKQNLVVGDNGGGGASKGTANMFAANQQPTQENFVEEKKNYGIQFQLKDEESQQIYSDIPYSITYKNNGKVETGWTDSEGKTHTINASSPEEVEFQTIDASKSLPPL
nr:PAAR domain-containing protein [Acinetobacter sp. Marseille-Q1620]